MVEYVSACKQSSGWPLTVSVEAEKPRAEVAALLPLADVVRSIYTHRIRTHALVCLLLIAIYIPACNMCVTSTR